MCGGVLFTYKGHEVRVFFPEPKAVLPVRTKSGGVVLMTWGRRKENQGRLPPGGWARLDSIRAGRWDKYFPIPVKLPVTRFMEKDRHGRSNWYLVTGGRCIQGLVARDADERRVYVVTVEPGLEGAEHDRWPRILSE